MNRRQFFTGVAAAGTAALVPKLDATLTYKGVDLIFDELTQVSWHHHPDIMVAGESFTASLHDIVTETLRLNAPEIARSLSTNNPLFERLNARVTK